MTRSLTRTSLIGGAAVLTLVTTGVWAQANKPAAPAGGKTFILNFDATMINGVATPLSLNLRETRQGAAVKQTEIEGCFAFSHASHKLDLVRGVLTQRDGALRFTGTTLVNKAPVDIAIQRTGKPDAPTFTGELKSADRIVKFAYPNAQFAEDEGAEPSEPVETSPNATGDNLPNTVALVLKPSAIPALVPVLRKHSAKVEEHAFFADCDALRSDEHKITAQVDPDKAAAFVADAKAVAGVTRAGWTTGSFGIGDAVRFDAAAYTTNGQIDRAKIFAAISPALAAALGEKELKQPETDTQGMTILSFGGPSQALPGLGLNEQTDLHVFIAREGLAPNAPLVIYLDEIDTDMVDTQKGIKIKEAKDLETSAEDFGVVRNLVQMSIAKALGGEVWSYEKKAWIKK